MKFEERVKQASHAIMLHCDKRVVPNQFSVEDILRNFFGPLNQRVEQLEEDLHLSNGCADLAMNHRDVAESGLLGVGEYIKSLSDSLGEISSSLAETASNILEDVI